MKKAHFTAAFQFFFLLLLVSACGGSLLPIASDLSPTPTPVPVVGGGEPAVRLIFHQNNFTDISDYAVQHSTSHSCLGDILRNFYANGPDYTGAPTQFPYDTSGDQLLPTTRPYFVKNVSVDITQTYYALTQSGQVQTDHCSLRNQSDDPGPSSCASFDNPPPADPAPTIIPIPTATPTITPVPTATATPTYTPLPTPTPVATPTITPTPSPTAQFYNTGYYHTRDDYCTGQGPTQNADPETTKANVGGVSIDIDRTALGANEDLLMMVTYHALNENSVWPGPQVQTDRSVLQVNLVATGQALDTLIGVTQPRSWTYSNLSQYPILVKKIATLEDPYGSLRTEQVYLPISQNSLIDRVRIERVRGSYHLFQIDLYRLGNRQ